ncbi:tetratricopeptide repeat protein [Variovorax sp. YR216]|uniref:tetratricopeptide repeat protein n=1 Tax=Variovorax sp. YR216 TaxID=1882828 RepID=UPI00089CA1A4|nr:tetratricopeptide repeat protein [Variovorax sp. YR216]SEB25585.1 TolB amino-terminal domain-containing protein [Variovorax sp. YR216]
MSNPAANPAPAEHESSGNPSDGERVVSFAGFVFEPARQELRKADVVVPLSPKSLALLRYFLSHEGRVLGKDELIRALWGAVVVTDDSLVQCVKDLRTALGDRDQQIIKTLPRRGYMFDTRVTVLPPPSADEDARTPPRAVRRRWWGWPAAGVLTLATLAATGAWYRREEPSVNIDQEIINRRAIAVLAFNDKRGRAAGSTLGDDLADTIGTHLVRTGTRVIGRAATVHQDSATPEFEHIGRDQGVRFVIGGRVTRDGDSIRVDTYLTEIASGAVYLLQDATFKSDDEAERSSYGLDVANALRARYYEIETERARLPGHERDPVDAIALGLRDLDQGSTKGDFERARQRFEFAASIDPNSVEASIWVGAAHLLEFYSLQSESPREELDITEKVVRRALDLAPDNPQNLTSWAEMLMLRGRPDEALWVWKKSLDISPDYQNGHLRLANALIRQGRFAEAQQHIDKVTDLRPYQTRRQQLLNQSLADAAFAQGRDDEAYEILMKWSAEFPNNGKPYLMLAAIDALHGRDAAATANMAKHRQMLPLSNIAYVVLTYPSSDPSFLAQRARLVEGLRKAGLPESGK